MDRTAIATALERFGQVVTNPAVGAGTGLGLPLAKERIEAHGGGLEPTGKPGQGTKATIRFPRAMVMS
jgi:signal transduction histidine kinase